MKKALCLVLCLYILVLAGCGQDQTDSGTTTAATEATTASTSNTETTEASEITEPSAEITEPSTEVTEPSTEATEPSAEGTQPSETQPAPIWMDFHFKMDDVAYELPCDYQYFTDDGWSLDENYSSEDLIPGSSIQLVYLEREGQYLAAQLLNASGNARSIEECAVCSVTVFFNSGIEFQIVGGVTMTSTQEQIRTALGEPAQSDEIDGEIFGMTYTEESKLEQEIYFDFTSGYEDIYKIEITNYDPYAMEDTKTSTERPAYLDSYRAPTELGEERTAAIFQLDGVIYQLPCPMEVFVANGWTYEVNDRAVKGLGKDTNYLVKGDLRFTVDVMNYDAAQQSMGNCAVTFITFNDYDLETAPEDLVVLPGNITFWQAKDAAPDVFSGFEMSKYEGSVTYRWEKYENVGYLFYQAHVKYHESPEYELYYLSYCNEFWDYE